MGKEDRLVVVTYDAGADKFTVNPNPVDIPRGTHTLYFALQTMNKGYCGEAKFTGISITNMPEIELAPVDGFRRLYKGQIDNTLTPDDGPMRWSYEVACEYGELEREADLDPSIVLLPPPRGATS